MRWSRMPVLAQDSSLWAKLFPRACWPLLWLLRSHLWCPLPGTFGSFLPSVFAAPLGRGPSSWLPFSLFHCSCHPQWPVCLLGLLKRWDVLQSCSHPRGLQTFSSLELERPGFSSCNYIGVGSFWGMGVTLIFFLACNSLFGGRTSRRLLQKGSDSGQQNLSASGGKYESGHLFSVVSWKKFVFWQFKGIQNFRHRIASERICCFELQSLCVSAACQYSVL